MCGIAGFFRPAGLVASAAEEILARVNNRLLHRGPDDGGAWIDAPAGIALGHRRLAILDLSPAGHQPMHSASGRYVIVYNGEIYNHLAIREQLERAAQAPAWRGHSDTETLLAGFDVWGIERTLQAAVGMFAFALWDREERILTLARDRVGEKPLYFGWQGDEFLFGSELKALCAHPRFRAEIDREALAMYMRRGYFAAPKSIYRGIFKVMPGTFAQLSVRSAPGSAPQATAYWSLREIAERGLAAPLEADDEAATDALEAALKRAVSQQSLSDVPLGAFLSGGIDSTIVVALLQAQAARPVRTFTIGFLESEYHEADHARAVAQRLGTEHTELYVTPRETMDVIPKLASMYDEPFGDSSAIPTHLVSQLARRHVTVCLSGDGGDELFGGYTRYRRTEETWRMFSRVPGLARSALSFGCRAYARSTRVSASGWKARRLALYLSARTAGECYTARTLLHDDAHDLVPGSGERLGLGSLSEALDASLSSDNIFNRMMYADALTYLPDDILAKVDRASMAVSLESRVPLLDHRVLELAWRLPLRMKVRNGESKWLLKRVLHRHVPQSLMERPKMGFGVPVNEWVRGPMRAWAEDLLSESRLRADGMLNPRLVRELWSRHVAGLSDEGDSLWQVLMFQAWFREQSTVERPDRAA